MSIDEIEEEIKRIVLLAKQNSRHIPQLRAYVTLLESTVIKMKEKQ